MFREHSVWRNDELEKREKMFSKEFICEIQVAISSLCFGLSFVGQRIAAESDPADPMTYNSWRFIISFFSVYLLKERLKSVLKTNISQDNQSLDEREKKEIEKENNQIPIFQFLKEMSIRFSMSEERVHLYFWGIVGGIINFVIQTSQQYGLQTVPAGKAALINGLFVVVTPFIESILPYFESHITFTSWCAILLSGVGAYFLSSPDLGSSTGFGYGECLLVVSMLGCCMVILISDVASKRADCIDLTVIELSTVLILSTGFSMWNHVEYWYWPLPALQSGILMVVFVGLSEATGFVLSTLGQMHITSHRASVLYGLEGVFASFFGYLFVGEILTLKELFGCLLIFIGTVLGGAPVEGEIEETEEETKLISQKQQLVEKNQKNYGSTV